MKYSVDIQGLDQFIEEMNDLNDKFPLAISRTANFVAQSTVQRVKHKIRTGSRSGNIYGRHQASAPGEPPANLTGELAASYTYTRMTDRPGSRATAGSPLPKARVLEFGGWTVTSPKFGSRPVFIMPRPVLLPSFLEAINAAKGRLKQEFERLR